MAPAKKAKPKAKPKRAPKRKRPSAGDAELRAKLIDAIKMGLPVDRAAAYAGFKWRTFYAWQAKGRDDLEDGKRSVYASLVQDIDRARAEWNHDSVKCLMSHAKTDAKTMLKVLARRDPSNWGMPGKRLSNEQEEALHQATIDRVQAETELTRARAAALQKVADGDDSLMLFPQDELDAMSPALRSAFMEHLLQRGIRLVSPPRLSDGVSQADIDAASPSRVVVDAVAEDRGGQ